MSGRPYYTSMTQGSEQGQVYHLCQDPG